MNNVTSSKKVYCIVMYIYLGSIGDTSLLPSPETNASPGVGDEVEERRSEGSQTAVREHPVQH